MHEVYYYEDRKGYSQAREYIQSLMDKGDKDSRIKLKKIR